METFFHLLIGAYLGVGVVAFVFSLIGNFVLQRLQAESPQESYARLLVPKEPGLAGLRWRAVLVLQALTLLVTWPAASAAFLQGVRRRSEWATFSLRLRDLFVMHAVVFFGFSLVLLGVAVAVGPTQFVQTGCATLLVALVCEYCSYAVATTDLPSGLRQERRNPYLAALTITLLEFAAIVIASVVLNRWSTDGSPGPGTFVDEARRVLTLGHVQVAITSVQKAPSSCLVAAAGLSFYVLGAKQLTQFRKFHRSAEDYALSLQRLLFSGDFDKARALIDDVSLADRNNSGMLELRIQVLLAQGAFDAALELTQALFTLNRDPSSVYFATNTQEDLFWWMVRHSIPFSHWRVLDVLRERGVSDGLLYSCVAFNLMYDKSEETDRRLIAMQEEMSCPITASYCALLTVEPPELESAVSRAKGVFSSCASSPLITDSIIARVAGIEIGALPGFPLENDLVARSGDVVGDAASDDVPVWALHVVWQRLSLCLSDIEAFHGRRDVARDIESHLAPVLARLSSAERRRYRAYLRSAVKERRGTIRGQRRGEGETVRGAITHAHATDGGTG